MHACMHACMHAYIHTHIHACMHALHACMHNHILQTYIHAHALVLARPLTRNSARGVYRCIRQAQRLRFLVEGPGRRDGGFGCRDQGVGHRFIREVVGAVVACRVCLAVLGPSLAPSPAEAAGASMAHALVHVARNATGLEQSVGPGLASQPSGDGGATMAHQASGLMVQG